MDRSSHRMIHNTSTQTFCSTSRTFKNPSDQRRSHMLRRHGHTLGCNHGGVTLVRRSQVVTGGHGWSRVGHGCYVGLASPSFLQVTGGSRAGHGSIPGESCHDRSPEHAKQCLPATELVHRHHLRRRLRVLTTKCMKSTELRHADLHMSGLKEKAGKQSLPAPLQSRCQLKWIVHTFTLPPVNESILQVCGADRGSIKSQQCVLDLQRRHVC